jgi:hypothetical protein
MIFTSGHTTLWTDTVLTTGAFAAQNFCNCASVGALCGYMQDAIAHDSGCCTSTETAKTHHSTA